VETGVLGLAAVLALTAVAALLCLRAARWGDPLALPLGAGLAGFAVIGLADQPANAIRISVVLWMLLGLVAGSRAPVVTSDGVPTEVLAHVPAQPRFVESVAARMPDEASWAPLRTPSAARCNGRGEGSGHGPTGTSTRSSGAKPLG
jgi:hypothetical protein